MYSNLVSKVDDEYLHSQVSEDTLWSWFDQIPELAEASALPNTNSNRRIIFYS